MEKGSEFYDAVFGFASYLTGLKQSIKVGATEDASVMAELASDFCEANNALYPTDDFPDNINHPN